MAETDILNGSLENGQVIPIRGWSNVLGCNPNWSYGWIRKTASNKKIAQPRLGRRYSRELANAGYSANLNFIDQPYAQVLRLKRFYEQFKNGYFTLINWDGFGRHHVGNFTTEPNEVETANGKWTIQGLLFEEAPEARMLEYPSDWVHSSHTILTVDDYLVPLVANASSVTAAWSAVQTPAMAGTSLNNPASYELLNATPTAADFAQAQYVGWGFRMAFRTGSGLGQFSLYLDGTLLITIDQSTGLRVGSGALPAGLALAGGVVTMLEVPLDAHRVKMVALAVAGSIGSGTGVAYPALQVMH